MAKRRTGPKPLCRCGCGQRVKGYENTWATPQCVPKSLRSAGAKKGRRTFAYRRRALLFRAELEVLLARPTLSREDITVAFNKVYDRGWRNGWHTAWDRHRQGKPEPTVPYMDERIAS